MRVVNLLWLGLFAAALAAPVSAQVIPQPSGPVPIGCAQNTVPPTLADGQAGWVQCSTTGALITAPSNYPAASTPLTVSTTGTTLATTATMAATASVTNYLCGFSIRANATAAATGNATVTGTISGTLNFTQFTAPLASGIGTVEQWFTPCIPASAVNTAIAVISAAPGAGGTVSVSAWGFKQ